MLRPDSQPDPFRSRPPVSKPVNPIYNHITRLTRFKTERWQCFRVPTCMLDRQNLRRSAVAVIAHAVQPSKTGKCPRRRFRASCCTAVIDRSVVVSGLAAQHSKPDLLNWQERRYEWSSATQPSKKCCVHATVVFNNQTALKSIVTCHTWASSSSVTSVHNSIAMQCIWTLSLYTLCLVVEVYYTART